jgi:copper(I)-binding protein
VIHPRAARSLGALALAAVAVGPLVGCGAGPDATAREQYSPSDGVFVDVGAVRANNILVVADDSGQGAVVMTLTNDGDQPDELVEVTLPGAGEATVEGPQEIAPGESLTVGTGGDTQIMLSGLEAVPGESIELRFALARAGDTTVTTVVLAPEGDYAEQLPAASG